MDTQNVVPEWGEPSYDQHAFAGKRARAVSAKTRLSWQDFERGMHVQRRVSQQIRRLPTPAWALSNESVREVVLNHLENRLYITRPVDEPLADDERMLQINAAATEQIPWKVSILARHQARHQEATKQGYPADYISRLEIQIQNVDSEIVILRRGLPALLVAVAYLYYRLGWNSVNIANELSLKSSMIRVWLYRMNQEVNGRRSVTSRERRHRAQRRAAYPPALLQHFFVMRMSGLTWDECAKALKVSVPRACAIWRTNFDRLSTGRCHRRTARPAWSLERVQLLKTLRSKGNSFRQCAKSLGLTTDKADVYSVYAAYRRHVRP